MPAAALKRKPRRSRTLSPGREFRRFAATGLEVRSAEDGGDQLIITGSPIMYGVPYTVWDALGEFEETMEAGVASDLLAATPDVRFLFNHDGLPLARSISGTLTLTDTEEALTFRAVLDARQQLANDLAVAIERGDVSQMSCGFVVGRDTWNSDYTKRSIQALAELFDVSAVTYPASPATSIELSLRSLMAAPIESRARFRKVWIAAREAREGKVLSAENAGLLQSALEALHEADAIDVPAIVTSLQTIDAALDAGQAGISELLGKVNPDGGADDLEPELEPANEDDEDGSGEGDDEKTSTDPADASGSDDDGTEDAGNTDEPGLADGTGTRSSAPATRELRKIADQDLTFTDTERALRDALQAKYGNGSNWYDLWLMDCSTTWVAFQCWENDPGYGTWQAPYTITDGVITIGEAIKVIQKTVYEPADPSPEADFRSVLELEAEQLRLRGRRHRV